MDGKPNAKFVVVTGASRGIGEACALRLEKRGLHVFAGVRTESARDLLRKKASGGLLPLYIDVTIPESIASAQETVAATVGSTGLSGLVNNAGVPLGGPLEFLALDDLRKQLEVNLIGAIAVTQAFLPLLRNGRGRIVNISSTSGLIALPFHGPYAATKFALEAITDSLRLELRPWGISVSSVEPGNTATSIWEKASLIMGKVVQAYPPQAHELYGPVLSRYEGIKKHGIHPDHVAKAVEHALLARRPKARYLVGQDARALAMIRYLPVGIRDWLITRLSGWMKKLT